MVDETIQASDETSLTTPSKAKQRRSRGKQDDTVSSSTRKQMSDTAPARSSRPRRYSDDEKTEKLAQIKSRLENGASLKAIVADLGISEQTYYNWKRASSSPELTSNQQAENKIGINDLIELEAENVRLRILLEEKLRAENADLRRRLGL
jgi:putative transposase